MLGERAGPGDGLDGNIIIINYMSCPDRHECGTSFALSY